MTALIRPDPDVLAADAIRLGASQKKNELARLIRRVGKLRPKVVVEIGTFKGGTLYAWCKLAAADALIVSIDLPPASEGAYGFDDLEPLRAYARTKQDLHLLRADSHDPETLEVVSVWLDGRPIDYLFIDGDHSYAGVKADFELYSPLVRPGGIVAFHDILHHYWYRKEPKPWGKMEVAVDRYWNEIKSDYAYEELCTPGDRLYQWGGIGVLNMTREPGKIVEDLIEEKAREVAERPLSWKDATAALAGAEGATLDQVGSAAIRELARRLASPVLAQDLSATGLLTFATAYAKFQERETEKPPPPPERELDVLEIIARAGLPSSTKADLLKAEIERVRRRSEVLHEALREMEKEAKG